jgi:hypothetical protein
MNIMDKVKLHTRMYGWKYVWKEFAEEFGATVDDPNPDSSSAGMSMIVPITKTPWALIYTMDPGIKGANGGHTSIEVNYAPRGDFKFAIHPQKKIDDISKLLGMQDIIIGDKSFDPLFIVKGNDVGKVRDLFSVDQIRAHIIDEPTVQIWTHSDKMESKLSPKVVAGQPHILSLRVPGAVDDFERLKRFYELMGMLLITMCKIEAAVEG